MRPRRPAFTAALLVACVLALALRLHDLGREPFWYDESVQLGRLDGPFSYFVKPPWKITEPPLNELTAWTWARVLTPFGLEDDEAWARAPMVAFGVAAVAVAALAADAAFGPVAGIAAALVLATNPYHVRYSQETRMYALLMLMSVAMLLFLVRALRSGTRRDALLFGAAAIGAVAAHYYALMFLGAAAVATTVTWWRTRDRRLAWLLRVEGVICAAAIPVFLLQALHIARVGGVAARIWLKRDGPPGLETVVTTGKAYATYMLHAVVPALAPGSIDAWLVTGAMAALAAAIVAGVAARRDDEPPHLRLHLVLMIVLPFAAVLAVSQLRPIYQPRYLSMTLPALLLLAVRARPPLVAAGLAVLPIAMGALVEPRFHDATMRPDYRSAAVVLAAEMRPPDVVWMRYLDQSPLELYLKQVAPGSYAQDFVDRVSKVSFRRPAEADRLMAGTSDGRHFVLDVLLPHPMLTRDDVRDRLDAARVDARGRELVHELGRVPYVRLWRDR